MEILRNIYGNAGIPENDLLKISEKHHLISFSKGDYLLKEGEYLRGILLYRIGNFEKLCN
jgi:CRP-like cAMP-binding protein